MFPTRAGLGSNRGFTLIELVITVAIVGLLAAAAVPLAELTVRRAKETELRAALREIRGAIDSYKKAADQGRVDVESGSSGYPPTLAVLIEGAEDTSTPDHKRIYFLRRLPRDPFWPESDTEAEQTWGLRSYESSSRDPQPGEDVFDVRSLQSGIGLDGVPYSEW